MKIIRCHINNFGCLSDVSVEFNSGLNVINEENGWGKSTLAAFLRIMLFGFDGETLKKEGANERKRFMPWNKAKEYGGMVEVESEGKTYRIAALFADNKKNDEISVKDTATNLDFPLYEKSFGEIFFQINAYSFEKTVFLAQNDCAEEVSDDVRAKLGNVADAGDDINNSNKAVDALKKAINEIYNGKSKGKIVDINAEIAPLEKMLFGRVQVEEAAESLDEKIRELKDESHSISKRMSEITGIISEESSKKDLFAQKDKYYGLINALSDRESAFMDAKRVFPNGIPKEDDIRRVKSDFSESMLLLGTMETLRLTPEENEKMSKLSTLFIDGYPDDETFSKIRNCMKEEKELADNISEIKLQRRGEDRYRELADKYIGNVPDVNTTLYYTDLVSKRADASQLLERKKTEQALRAEKVADKTEFEKGRVKGKKAGLIVAGMTIVLLAIVMYKVYTPLALIGVAGLILMMAGLLVKPREVNDNKLTEITNQIEEIEAEIEDIDNETEEFLESIGISCHKSQVAYNLLAVQNDAEEYAKLHKKLAVDESIPLMERRENVCKYLDDVFEKYMPSENGDFQSLYQELYSKTREFEQLTKKHDEFVDSERKYNAALRTTENYLTSNGFEASKPLDSLENMQHKLNSYNQALVERDKAKEEKEAFEKEYPNHDMLLALEKPAEEVSIISLDEERVALEGRLSELGAKIRQYEDQLDSTNERLEDISFASDKIERLREKRAELEHQLGIYQKTKTLLEEAKLSFIQRYTGPMQKAFRKYIALLTDENPETFFLDVNMELTKEENGIQRKRSFFSSGQQDAMGICMRMSMIDAMYENEKPFVIMDDPFNNLDDASVTQGLSLLEKLGTEHQILYFTCSESRDYAEEKFSARIS